MRFAYTALAVMLAGCATTSTSSSVSSPVWTQNGRPVASDVGLTEQFQTQRTTCLGNGEKAGSGTADATFLSCMAQKGYMLILPGNKTPISQQQFATLTEEQRSEAISR